jgi:ADP-ribosylglycohydrolase
MNNFLFAILNGALGDQYGLPIEMMPIEYIHSTYGKKCNDYIMTDKITVPYIYSDDTEMTIGVIKFLINVKKKLITLTRNNMIKSFAENYEPSRGYSRNTSNLFVNFICDGVIEEQQKNSNGGLMRTFPILPLCQNRIDDEIIELIKIIYYPTHINEESYNTGLVYIKLLLFFTTITNEEKKEDKIKNYIIQLINNKICMTNLENNLKIILERWDEDQYNVLEDIFGWDCVECYNTLSTALWCVIKNINVENKSDILAYGIFYGGDCDTLGSIIGQMTGILFGYDAINQSWLINLENRPIIEKLVNDFLEYYSIEK